MNEPARPLSPEWQKVLNAAVGAERPDNSQVAETAAQSIDSPCVVVISVNREEGKFEARCYGNNPDWFRMAGKMADAALAGINAADPESD